MKHKHDFSENNQMMNECKNSRKQLSLKQEAKRKLKFDEQKIFDDENYHEDLQEYYHKKQNPAKKIAIIILLLLVCICIAGLYFYRNNMQEHSLNDNYAMGSKVNLTACGKNGEAAVNNAYTEVSLLDGKISDSNMNSEIARIAQKAGFEPVKVVPDTMTALKYMLEVAKATDGMYDPTIGPLVSMWNFSNNGDYVSLPDKDQVNLMMDYVGYDKLVLDENNQTAYLTKQICSLEMNSVKDGEACDDAINTYKSNNVKSGIVTVGSSVGTLGTKAINKPWTVALYDPSKESIDSKQNETLGKLKLSGEFVSSESIYNKYAVVDGQVYHHILNPKTGYPADTDLIGASVVANNGALSDILSTACLTVGLKASKDLLNKFDAQAVFVDNDNHVYITSNLKDKFTLTDEKYTLCVI